MVPAHPIRFEAVYHPRVRASCIAPQSGTRPALAGTDRGTSLSETGGGAGTAGVEIAAEWQEAGKELAVAVRAASAGLDFGAEPTGFAAALEELAADSAGEGGR
jgi:hypothetical protein